MALREIVRHTALGRLLVIPVRLVSGLKHTLRHAGRVIRWAFSSREYYNHTYHLTPLNREYLISYIAVISGHDESRIEGFFRELENDAPLRQLLERQTLNSPDRHNSDVEPRYGRRTGWYALVRATRPKIIVETGVDRGLGTVVLAAAIARNVAEGFPGLVYATDIVPDCGHLLAEPYKSHCRILLGDSVESLKNFAEPVDIFLHDSDHRPEYEWAEFTAIEPRLHPRSIVMSDNSQQSSKMREFAARLRKNYLYFQDVPENHWWPGDGIGAAFTPGVRTSFQQA
ncbi:MAG: hypothetical protein QOF48_1699 [Verrucomicrobiota bacterium]|jgi:predicted O-methyltransferase YrrM